ncbi:MAG: cadherin-like domain-containing protein [Verrucomicrobia bacterium]|nr:cadherin-like domain-containing protein [Verrucomicrobiota bacterium]
MPDSVAVGESFFLTNTATPAASVGVYAVEDQVPAGWAVSQISHGGALDTNQWKLKWGPFFDNTARVLTCRITPPALAEGRYTFTGQSSFDGEAVSIVGARQITVRGAGQASAVVSFLQPNYVPGLAFAVTNSARPGALVQVYSVEDQVPIGWNVASVSHSGVFDATNSKVKWGPFFDHTARELSFQITPPLSATGLVTFNGVGSFDGQATPITGQRETRPVTSTVISTLPARFQPTVAFTVTLSVAPSPEVTAWAAQDRVPDGWTVSSIGGDGSFDATNQTVKWGPYFTNAPAVLSYQVTPPAGAIGTVTFAGVSSFNGVPVPITGQRASTAADSRVVRTLPLTFLPGLGFTVTNATAPASNVTVYAVQDQLPANWSVNAVSISEGGQFDTANHQIKWGPFFDSTSRVLTYQAIPPAGAVGAFVFNGVGSFDGLPVVITGDRQTIALPPAQANVIVRVLPETLRAGGFVLVTNFVSVAENVTVYALEEQIPSGLSVSNITGGGAFDAGQRKLKWGPFFDNQSRQFSYRLCAPTATGGLFPLGGVGSFDGQPVLIAGPSELTVLPNQPPVARPDSLQRLWDQNGSVPLSKLLLNDSDPNGDPLSLLALPAFSAHGATISLSNGVVYYAPPAGFNEADTFTYSVADAYGGEASAIVSVTAYHPAAGQNIKAYGATNGCFWLLFGGVPGRTYTVEATDSLSPPSWSALGSSAANALGEFLFVDPDTHRSPLRVYRSRWP